MPNNENQNSSVVPLDRYTMPIDGKRAAEITIGRPPPCYRTLMWASVVNVHGLDKNKETDHHPHHVEEDGDLFHCCDGDSSEYETLNLLHALVLAYKPLLVVETGTSFGYGTAAIASALKYNGRGMLHTVDIQPCDDAKDLIFARDLQEWVKFETMDSVEFLKNRQFDFAYLDTEQSIIRKEYDALQGYPLVLLHGTSLWRENVPTDLDYIEWAATLAGMRSNLARGWTLTQKEPASETTSSADGIA